MSIKLLQQRTEEEATADKDALQLHYDENGAGGIVIAKTTQINAWTSMGIPLGRSGEFDVANMEVKTQYALISIYASGAEYQDATYVDAWELEYTKMFP